MVLFVWECGDEILVKVLVVGKLFKFLVDEIVKDELKVDMCDEFFVYFW